MPNYAPGMRVIIRDEEWMIKKCDSNSYQCSRACQSAADQLQDDRGNT